MKDIKKVGVFGALGLIGTEFVAFLSEALRSAVVSLFRRRS